MGQITSPAAGQINVAPIDREAGPGAGAGASGNNSLFLGLNAGQNSTVSNFIVIGNNSAIGGVIGAALNGTVILGQGNVPVLTTGNAANTPSGMTIIGQGNALLMQKGDSSVIVGQGNLPLFTASGGNGLEKSVVIGNGNGLAVTSATAIQNCVLIGYKTLLSSTLAFSNCIVIGALGLGGITGAGAADATIIGNSAHLSATGSTQDTVIGSAAGSTGGGSSVGQVMIGYSAISQTGSAINNVLVGSHAQANGSSNVAIGFTAKVPVNNTGARSISIGAWAGRTLGNTQTDILTIETNDPAGSQKTAIYCRMAEGNILLGGMTDAAGRATFFPQTSVSANNVGIPNGTRGVGNPTGGGFFYVSAGALHWVGSAGTDTVVAPA